MGLRGFYSSKVEPGVDGREQNQEVACMNNRDYQCAK